MKVIIGAGNTSYEGWTSTQENELDVLNRADFERMFAIEKPTAFLAEHVWEHMSLDDGIIAAQNCFDFLADGGYVRAAVPDVNFRNEWYQNMVKVGGNGDPNHPAFTHKIVYDYKTLRAVFEKAGFEVELLEYCDESGAFHYKHWDENDGKIGRSLRFDTRNNGGKLGMVSIILDAQKPIMIEKRQKGRHVMTVNCVWEHNGNDTLLYAVDFVGAYARGEGLDAAISKMPDEIVSYLKWIGGEIPGEFDIIISQEKDSELNICDADSDVIFESEKEPLTIEEYDELKALALRSAKDFLALYDSIPDKTATASPERKTFYGNVPRSANEMYEHNKNVNGYYFSEIDVDADNDGDIYECRQRGFVALESKQDFLENLVIEGSYSERWSLRKVFRRFIWHDRIHARAMYRMAVKVFGAENVENPFCF
jgi:predicted SAM-dependent methyltransferase